MRKKMTVRALIAAQAETHLSIVNQILLDGSVFAPAPEKPVGKKEKIIGELSLFEKAIYTAWEEAEKTSKNIADTNNAAVNKALESGEIPNLEEVEKSKKLVAIKVDDFKVFGDLLWASIGRRLQASNKFIGIRQNFQIVQISQISVGIGGGDLFSSLGLISGLLGEILGGHDHDCGTCLSYEECDLSIKKPR